MRIHHRSRQSRTGSLPHFSNQPRDSRAGDARSGAALILALAILLVLLSLAITFFLIVRFETNIARQAYDRAQAAHLLDAALAQGQYRLNRDLEAHGDVLSLDQGWRAWFSGAAFRDKVWARDPVNGGLPGFSIEGVERALRGTNGENVLYAFFPKDRYLEPLFRGPRTEAWMQVPRKQQEWIFLYAPASEMRLVNARGDFLDGGGNDFTALNDALNAAGRTERFTRWTEWDVQNRTRLPFSGWPEPSYPDFITPAFFDPDDPAKPLIDDPVGFSEDIVSTFADVDSDGDGMKDAMWMPLSRDINHHGDGIDNDLDGNPDPLRLGADSDGDGVPDLELLFEAAPFVYHGWGLPEAAKSEDPDGLNELRPVPWNLRERLIDNRGDGLDNDGVNGPDNAEEGLTGNVPRLFLTVPLPGLVTQVDLNSDGLFDDRDHYRVDDGSGVLVDLGPLFVRLPDVLWVTVITGEDNTGAETYARAPVTIEDVDVLDNDFDLTVNNFRSYAYLGEIKPGYHHLNVDAVFAQDGTSGRQNLQFFYLRWNAIQGQFVQDPITLDPNLIDINNLRISCTGESVSEITGRYALNITDEASKVNLNAAGGYFTDVPITDVGRDQMQRSINRGVTPFEYETRLLPNMGTDRPREFWGMRTGTEPPQYSDAGVAEPYLPDAWLPGYGFVDDDGDALLLSLSLRDESGGGLRGEGLFQTGLSPLSLHYLEPKLNGTNLILLNELNSYPELRRLLDYELESTRALPLYNRLGRFEGIDEPSELHLYNPLPNPFADYMNATGLYADRLLLRKENLQDLSEVGENTWDYLRNLVTVNSDRRNTFAAEGYGRDRNFLRVDPNYATAGQLAANLILRGNISNIVDGLDTGGLAAPLAGRYFAEGLRQFDTAFTGDLMGYERTMNGNVHEPGMRFPADPVLQAMRLAADMAAARDRSYGRHKLVTETLLRNPDVYLSAYRSAGFNALQRGDVLYEDPNERERIPGKDLFPAGDVQEYFYDSLNIDFAAKRLITPDLWWKGQTGEDRLVQYAAASLDAIRINEVMVRPVRRVEAETLPLTEQGQVSANTGNQSKINLDPAPYTGMPVFDIAAYDAAGLPMNPASTGPWSLKSAYGDQPPLLGDRSAWVYTPDPAATPNDFIEFRFQATDGLPAGRYYLTVNLTDQYGRMTVNAPDVLQYAVKYTSLADPKYIADDIPFMGYRPEDSSIPVPLAELFYELNLPYLTDLINNLQNHQFQAVDQPEFLSTPTATDAGSGAAPGWAFLPVRSLEETFPLAENEYLVRFLVDALLNPEDQDESAKMQLYIARKDMLEAGWDFYLFHRDPITNDPVRYMAQWWNDFFSWHYGLSTTISADIWADLRNQVMATVPPPIPANPEDPYRFTIAVIQLFDLLDSLYGSRSWYYADGLDAPDDSFDMPPPVSGRTYTVMVPQRDLVNNANSFELCIALRLSPIPRDSYTLEVAEWLNWYNDWNGAFDTAVCPPQPLTPAEYQYLTSLLSPTKPLPETCPLLTTLAVNFFDFSQEPAHEYLELANVSGEEVDVSGWRLEVGVPDPVGIEKNRYLEDPYKSVWRIPEGTKVAPNGHLLLGFDVMDKFVDEDGNIPVERTAGAPAPAMQASVPLVSTDGMGLAAGISVETGDLLRYVTVPPMADPPLDPVFDLFKDLTGSVFRRANDTDYIDNDGDGLSSAPFLFTEDSAPEAALLENAITNYMSDNNITDTPENRRKVRYEVFDTDGVLAEFKTHGVSTGTDNTIPAWSRIVQLENIRLWRESVPGPWSDAAPEVPSAQEMYHYQLNPFTRNTRNITMADLDPAAGGGRDAALGRLARLVLRGGILPNYPERDGIDNDGDGGYVVEGKPGIVPFYPAFESGGSIPNLEDIYKEPLLSYVPGTLDKDLIDNNLNFRMDERGNEVRLWLDGSPTPPDLNLYYRHGNPLRSEGVDEGRLGLPVYFSNSTFRAFPNLASRQPHYRPNFYGPGSYELPPLPLFNLYDSDIVSNAYRTGWLTEIIYEGSTNAEYIYDYPVNGFECLRLQSFGQKLKPEDGFPWGALAGTNDYTVVANPNSTPVVNPLTDSPDWQAFVERRWNPGDNVIITLYAGDPLLKREADQVTYREYDVINRTLDDIAPSPYFADGFSNYATNTTTGVLEWLGPNGANNHSGNLVCLDPPLLDPSNPDSSYSGKPTFWLPDHMGLDFYRSLERKHPTYHGDRFGTANRWTATDGAYDDWADSLSVFQTGLGAAPYTTGTMPTLPGQVKYTGSFLAITETLLKHPGTERFNDPTNTYASDHALQLFGHALAGSPLRMNSQARLWENPADLGQLALDQQQWLNPDTGMTPDKHNLNLRYGRQFPGLDTYRNTGHHLLQMQAELVNEYPSETLLDPAKQAERRPAADWALRRAVFPKAPFHTTGDLLNLPSLSFERVVEGPDKYVPGGTAAFYWPQYAVSPLNTRYFINESDSPFLSDAIRQIGNESLSKYAYGYDRDLSGALLSQSVWGGGASVLKGYAGLDPDPVVEEVYETAAMDPVVLTVGQARVAPLWPAIPDARVPGTTTFLSDDDHRALFRWPNGNTPPHHWTPVYLFGLPMPEGTTSTSELPWREVRYPRRLSAPPMDYALSSADGLSLITPVYLFNSAFIIGQLYRADVTTDQDFLADTYWRRWPVPTVASVTVNETTVRAPSDRAVLYISGHDPAVGEENRAEALFVWDRDDGLENGTYTAYIGTFIPGMKASLAKAQNLLEEASGGTEALLSGQAMAGKILDWDPTAPATVGGYAGTKRFDPHLAFECITDRRQAEAMLPENADPKVAAGLVHPRIWGQLGEDTPGSKVYRANDEGYIFHSADPETAWRAVPVRITDNYLALRVRNMGAPDQIACISHVVLAPAPRARGIVNINTTETRRVVSGVTSNTQWTVELFNALMGLPGVVNALNPQRDRDLPPYISQHLGLPAVKFPKDTPSLDDPTAPIDPWRQRWTTDEEIAYFGPTVLGPMPPAIRDGIAPSLPALVRNSDTGSAGSWTNTLQGRAMVRLMSLVAGNRMEHPDGRYYTSPAELLKGIPTGGLVKADSRDSATDPLYQNADPPAPWPLSNLGTPYRATTSGFGPRTVGPRLVGELYDQRYDDIVRRFSQMSNLITTRSDVFEIIATVQSGSAYPDENGLVDYRGDGFFPQAEQRARVIYDRRARIVRQDESGQ